MSYNYQGFASLSVNLNRQKYGALDISQVFTSQADLDYYISKGAKTEGVSEYWLAVTPYPYAGQYLALVNNETREVSAFILVEKEDGTFATKEVGSAPVGDEKSITVEDGIVKIVGFDAAGEGAQPRKKADGTIEWVVPSTDTVDGLQQTVAGMQSDISTLQTDLDTAEQNIEDVVARVVAIEGDYLKTADKTALETAIATAKAEAISETKEQILGENVSADFDTLQEVADWIASDTTNSAQLINRVSAIENDYLKGADKTELQGEIDALETLIGTLPEGAVSTNVIAYIQEVVNGLKIGDYAKASDLTALAERVTTAEEDIAALKEVGAEKNVIATVDDTQFAIDENRNLTLLDIAMGKVTGLTEALAGKVDKVEGSRLITESEAEKLEKLVLGEDGSVSVSGTIAAGNVDGLAEWITARAGTLEGLSENNLTDTLLAKLNGIEDGAQVNVIESISVNGETVTISNKTANINVPVGTDAENGVGVATDGTMSVNSLNVNKLTQTENETLILNGGSSST